MSEEDLTVFDIKFNEAMKRLNSLYLPEEETNSNINSIKNYIERYRLEKSIENRNNKKMRIIKINLMIKENKL